MHTENTSDWKSELDIMYRLVAKLPKTKKKIICIANVLFTCIRFFFIINADDEKPVLQRLAAFF